MPSSRVIRLLLAPLILSACRTGRNYTAFDGPRYAKRPRAELVVRGLVENRLRIASFNIAFGRHMDSAIAVMRSDPTIRDADVILLQEMDAATTRRVAEAFDFGYVYYPAILNRRTGRDFGNAVLSRWPFVEDAKIVLPHVSRYARTQRTATAVTIDVGGSIIRVYSTHLGTVADVGSGARNDQLRAIIDDASHYSRVVIGGDMNAGAVGSVARAAGYAWPTERGPHTTRFGRWDHIFLKGLQSPDSAAAGTVLDVRGTSDHRPVWAIGILSPTR